MRILVTGGSGLVGKALQEESDNCSNHEWIFSDSKQCDLRNFAETVAETATETALEQLGDAARAAGAEGLSEATQSSTNAAKAAIEEIKKFGMQSKDLAKFLREPTIEAPRCGGARCPSYGRGRNGKQRAPRASDKAVSRGGGASDRMKWRTTMPTAL